eukprot:CAMPEP_0174852476 /NCGR_PEP_ID=MMETSP1114-20130205/25553_1 /TAXON_ID=312471 /ORGANISM="Neobodo designis, Strain CCAP 1951/1" /LENGTH=304 /DNA_ID=CAMNT_0016087073 /DNA_START=34 /DNA_END=948 /DNA_ORIENTATION=+
MSRICRVASAVALVAIAIAGAAAQTPAPIPCTNQANCYGHASSVQGNNVEGCICTCRNQWYGAQCQFCPPGVDYSQDCGACLPGYDGYPFCALACTIANNCSNHAVAVKGDSRTGCDCTCRNQWYGASCQACPHGVDASQDCATCLPGYENYPFCALACTIAGNCSNHAANVAGDSQTGCMCTCLNQWYGASCQACPPGVDASQDCATCLPGYSGYPFCAKTCTIEANCDNHAFAVRGNAKTGCECSCRNSWAGGTCNYCPPNFDASSDCASCAPGYTNYPYCNRAPQQPPRVHHVRNEKPGHF